METPGEGVLDILLTPIDEEISLQEAESKPLTPRQKMFVFQYMKDFNATQAAIRAGYSPDAAGPIAGRLMTYPWVKRAIDAAVAQRAEVQAIDATKVLALVSTLANSSQDHYVVDEDGQVRLAPGAPEGAMGAIESIDRTTTITYSGKNDDLKKHVTHKVKIKLWDKPGQIKLLGQHIGMFNKTTVEHTGKDGGPIQSVSRIENVIVDPKAK